MCPRTPAGPRTSNPEEAHAGKTAGIPPPPARNDEEIVPLPLPLPEPPEPPPVHAARTSGGTPGAARERFVIPAPTTIAIGLPPVDPTIPPIDYSIVDAGPGESAGSGGPAGAESGSPDGGGVLTLATVDRPVLQLPTPGAVRYPSMLRSAAIQGEVNARFIVDTTGRVEAGSLVVLETDHELFTASVRAALPAMRFAPAEAGGRKVRQLVEQRFVFELKN